MRRLISLPGKAADKPLFGPEPALGIPRRIAREAIKNWTEEQHTRAWKELPGLRHSKRFTNEPCKALTDSLLKLNRSQLRMIIAVYTGHAPVRGHLFNIGLFDGDPDMQILRNGDRNSATYCLSMRGVGSTEIRCLWETNCRTKGHKHSLDKGPVPIYT
jgi:hypothetical protein